MSISPFRHLFVNFRKFKLFNKNHSINLFKIDAHYLAENLFNLDQEPMPLIPKRKKIHVVKLQILKSVKFLFRATGLILTMQSLRIFGKKGYMNCFRLVESDFIAVLLQSSNKGEGGGYQNTELYTGNSKNIWPSSIQ